MGDWAMTSLRSIELFGGAGGLALGLHEAGFSSEVFVEWNKWACDSVRENQKAGFAPVHNWTVHEGDVRAFDWAGIDGSVDLVSGGPPCQPFSTGGLARAADDPRDMFPAAAEVVRTLQPRAFIFENVKGLTRSAFSNYFQLVQLRLTYPEVGPREGESWLEHLRRLQAAHTAKDHSGLHYNVTTHLVDAADFGVPQHRHRVFIIGFRSDVNAEWAMPTATHSEEALLRAKWVTGDYWAEHGLAMPEVPDRLANTVAKLRKQPELIEADRWRTVRDGLQGLPGPQVQGVRGWHNHDLQIGARIYPGHTGSAIDEPSKTLKAGAHGVPGGENMIRFEDGGVRYFSVREAARMQTFPDDYRLHGAWGEAMRQIGNAVPVDLAKVVGLSVASHLDLAGPLRLVS